MEKIVKSLLIAALLLAFMDVAPAKESSSGAKIVLEIEDFDNDDGLVISHLYPKSNKDKYPTKPQFAIQRKTGKLSGKKTNIVFDNVPFGEYAVSVHHDENSNGKMDRNFLGMPSEKYGFSNNPTITFSPPEFDECKIDVDKKVIKLKIKMKG